MGPKIWKPLRSPYKLLVFTHEFIHSSSVFAKYLLCTRCWTRSWRKRESRLCPPLQAGSRRPGFSFFTHYSIPTQVPGGSACLSPSLHAARTHPPPYPTTPQAPEQQVLGHHQLSLSTTFCPPHPKYFYSFLPADVIVTPGFDERLKPFSVQVSTSSFKMHYFKKTNIPPRPWGNPDGLWIRACKTSKLHIFIFYNWKISDPYGEKEISSQLKPH